MQDYFLLFDRSVYITRTCEIAFDDLSPDGLHFFCLSISRPYESSNSMTIFEKSLSHVCADSAGDARD